MNASSTIRNLTQSRFVRNLAKASTGKLTAMVVAVIATPVISRLFDPAEFGVASVVIALVNVAAAIYPLAYDRAVIFPKENFSAYRALVVAFVVSLCATVVSYAVLSAVSMQWPRTVDAWGLGLYLWVVPLAALLFSVRSIFGALCVRREDFSAIASADISESVLSAGSRILWGVLVSTSALGLIVGRLLGVVAATGILAKRSSGWLCSNAEPLPTGVLRKTAHEFRDYPLFRAPARVSFSAAMRLPVIALGMLFPAEVVGFYAMANRAAGLPLNALNKAISNVLLGKMMSLRHVDRPLARNLLKVLVVQIASGVPVFLLVYLIGENVLTWFLGDRWAVAGQVLEVLAPYLFVLWIGGSITNSTFESLRLNRLRLTIDAGSLILRIGIFVFCWQGGLGFMDTLQVFVLVTSAYRLLTYALTGIIVLRHDAELTRPPAGPGSKVDHVD